MSRQHEIAFREADQHLSALRNVVNAAGGPCHTCKHGSYRGGYSWTRVCRHPFVRRGTHDPVTGKVTWRYEDQRRMRETTCGVGGTLHEKVGVHVLAWRWMRTNWAVVPVTGVLAYVAALAWIIQR